MRHILVTLLFITVWANAVVLFQDARFAKPDTAALQAEPALRAGLATIRSVALLPGDLLLSGFAHSPTASDLTGITREDYGGWLSAALSLAGWVLIVQAILWWLRLPLALAQRITPRTKPAKP